jgi:hypothetical protein
VAAVTDAGKLQGYITQISGGELGMWILAQVGMALNAGVPILTMDGRGIGSRINE